MKDELYELEAELGKIREMELLCPGVYYISIENGEYYIVKGNTPAIPRDAREYGEPSLACPELLIYSMARPDSGWMVVRYEVCQYLARRDLPLPEDTTLREAAFFGMECHPEYFGTFPVPVRTPMGDTLRYWRLANGVCWLETDRCQEVLSVSFPIWDGELSEAVQKAAAERAGAEERYLFFTARASCIPLFELLRMRPRWERSGIIDSAALMNAIWQDFPAYALAYNGMEQAGLNDLPGTVLSSFGGEVGTSRRPERTIRLTPDAGTDFLRKERCHE